MCQKHRPFSSIFDCKIRAHKRDPFLIEGKNEIRYHMGAYGPLVVEHISEFHKKKLNKKVNNKNKNARCKSKNYRTPFTYFNIHSNCKETQQYWHNIQSPKILRHYTPPKSSKRNEHYYGW
jgi:hypothetical protein